MPAVAHSWKEVPCRIPNSGSGMSHDTPFSSHLQMSHFPLINQTSHMYNHHNRQHCMWFFLHDKTISLHLMVIPIHKHLAKKQQEHVADNFSLKKSHNAKLVPLKVVSIGSKSFLHSLLPHFKHSSETSSWMLFSCSYIFLYVLPCHQTGILS